MEVIHNITVQSLLTKYKIIFQVIGTKFSLDCDGFITRTLTLGPHTAEGLEHRQAKISKIEFLASVRIL